MLQCQITHLSNTNPTKLNGNDFQGTILLVSGDEICIGERKFLFERGDSRQSSPSQNKGVLKHVPLLETIDESITLDFSVKKGQPRNTPSRQSIVQPPTKHTPSTLPHIPEGIPQPEAPRHVLNTLSTPQRNAIQSHPENSDSKCSDNHADAEAPLPPGEEVAKRSALNTPIRNAIKIRRGALLADMHSLDMLSNAPPNETVSPSAQSSSELANLASPLRLAIHKRRQSLSAELEEVEQQAAVIERGDDASFKSPHRSKSLRTPLKRAIQEKRRKSISDTSALPSQAQTDTIVVEAGSKTPVKKSLKTPLRNAINARRKSLVAEVEALNDMETCEAVSASVDADDESKTPVKKSLKTLPAGVNGVAERSLEALLHWCLAFVIRFNRR